jgi:hypothetical protein
MKYKKSATEGIMLNKYPSIRLMLISAVIVISSVLAGCSTADNNRVGLRPTTGLGLGYFGGGGGGSFVGSGVGVGIGIGGSSGKKIDKKADRKQKRKQQKAQN